MILPVTLDENGVASEKQGIFDFAKTAIQTYREFQRLIIGDQRMVTV
jgi:hypothetical protein